MCHCGAVIKELLVRAHKPGSTPGDAVFCFFLFFFCFFSLLVTLSAWINIYFKLKSGPFILEKGFRFQKFLIHILAKLTTRKKKQIKRALYLRVNLFSTKVLIGETIF